MITAQFQYKCRLCGKVYGDAITSPINARTVLISIVSGTKMPKQLTGMQPGMISLHSACKSGYGVSDLIGYIEGEG